MANKIRVVLCIFLVFFFIKCQKNSTAPEEPQGIGRVYGEFQDATLYQEALDNNPAMEDWDAKKMWEGVTGATLQAKNFEDEFPTIQVFWGDSLMAISDPFGQFWFEIRSGKHSIKATCDGYKDATQIVTVIPDEKTYVIFILERNAAAKMAAK